MKTLYEEMLEKGLIAKNVTIELAWTVPYTIIIDQLIGLDIITYKPVKLELN